MPRVCALEVPHRFGEVQAQLDWIEAHAPACELLVLPETCLTGYVGPGGDNDLARFAEPRGGPTEELLRALARRSGRAILGPHVERDGGRSYNACVFLEANGDVLARYRKRHPWMPETWATPGESEPPLFAWRGLKLSLAICFDAQFLLEESPAALHTCDALLFPSAWTEFPPDTRPELLGGIAREFGCAVVNANWGKGKPRLPGQGRSMILDREGNLIAGGAAPVAELSPRG